MDNLYATLVKLKYEMITNDRDTWHLMETYPLEVKIKWVWRCVTDVEDLAEGDKEAEHCIQVAKDYRDGRATLRELDTAHSGASTTSTSTIAYHVATSAYFAAGLSSDAAVAAAQARLWSVGVFADRDPQVIVKMQQYIEWLVEELIIYEGKS